MKQQHFTLFVVMALAAGCSAPSQNVKPAVQDGVLAKIERHRTQDLRRLFCDEATISSLEKTKACLVQAGGPHSIEKTIGSGLPLDQLVVQLFGKGYDGQIKVISRDSIVQTPLVEYNPGKQSEIFVHPGDLVFVLGRE